MRYHLNMTPEKFSYNEDKSLEEIRKHVESTYNEHYVHKDKNGKTVQVNDILIANGSAEGFYVGSATKYISRYGKKNGRNRKDLLKAVHFVLLLMDLHNDQEPEIINLDG
jgi:hypothetical protein